jgi:hypothetical protein
MYHPDVVALDGVWEYIEEIQKHTNRPEESLLSIKEPFSMRREFAAFYSWAIPSKEAINTITKFADGDTVMEIGAGRGLWSALLEMNGCKVRPIDLDFDAHRRAHYFNGEHEFIEIERMSEQEMYKITKYASTLFFCWPCYDQPWAHDHLEHTFADKIVYIGEGLDGCNATDEFFDYLEMHFNHEETIDIPQWWGIHDNLEIWRR